MKIMKGIVKEVYAYFKNSWSSTEHCSKRRKTPDL
jgi:hypothetical protein